MIFTAASKKHVQVKKELCVNAHDLNKLPLLACNIKCIFICRFLKYHEILVCIFINLIKVKKHYITAVIYGMCICFWYIWNSSLYQPYFILVSFHCTSLIEWWIILCMVFFPFTADTKSTNWARRPSKLCNTWRPLRQCMFLINLWGMPINLSKLEHAPT